MNGHPLPDFRQLFRAAPGLSLVLTPDLHIVEASDAYLRATMTTRGGILGRGVFDVFPDNPDDPSATGVRNLRASLDRVRRNRRPDTMAIQKYDIRRPASEGGGFEERYWRPVNAPVLDADGEIAYIVHTVVDVTEQRELGERVRLDQQLRSSEARWRAVIESAVDGIIVMDAAGRIEAFNRAAERLFGYGEADVVGRNVNLLMPSPHHEEHDGYLARYHATGEAKIIGVGREVNGLRRDGTTFPLHLAVGEMIVDGERKFTGILHDLTDRLRMEERLREQTALARLGEMAAVIAHEVKNPLAGVRGAIEVIGRRLPAESRDRVVVREIISRIDGLNDLMKDLLLFARPPRLHPGPVDLVPLLRMTAAIISEDAALQGLRIEVGGASPPVTADAELLKVVFHNLIVNGAHAMQGTGLIHVSVAPVQRFCEVTVRDHGPGIPQDVREKIFTPFFTTKARGSGLGLPTAKRFVEAHHGVIAVECPPSGGTAVRVQLPLKSS